MVMSQLISLALHPVLLLVSIPLLVLALFTTAAAFSTLLFRVLLVYADLAAVLVKNYFFNHQPSKSPSRYPQAKAHHTAPLRGRRRSSSGEMQRFEGSRTPKSAESSGLGLYSAGTHRDFEGIGGWRIPNTEGDDVLWTTMNARLELPAYFEANRRYHRRSITSGAASAPIGSITSEQPQQQQRPTAGARFSGRTLREVSLANPHASKSTTELGTATSSKNFL